MKTCSKCKLKKALSSFSKFKRAKDGHKAQCKQCISITYHNNKEVISKKYKKYYSKNRESLLEYAKSYRKENLEKVRQANKEYRDRNLDKIKKSKKDYYINNIDKIKTYHKEYTVENKDKKKEYDRIRYQERKDSIKKRTKEYYEATKEVLKFKDKRAASGKAWKSKNRKRLNAYIKERRAKDPMFKLVLSLRSLVNSSLRNKGYSKKSKTYEILGASYETVRLRLEFTWLINYKTVYNNEKVHIDHIIPLSTAKTEEDIIKLNYYTNLQYLKPIDNLKKSTKLLKKKECIECPAFLRK